MVALFVRICEFSKVLLDEPLRMDVQSVSLMLTRIGEKILVTDTLCTHEKADLSLGILSGVTITCPLHQAKFDLRDGKVLDGPNGTEPGTIPKLRTYLVKIENDEVWADI